MPDFPRMDTATLIAALSDVLVTQRAVASALLHETGDIWRNGEWEVFCVRRELEARAAEEKEARRARAAEELEARRARA